MSPPVRLDENADVPPHHMRILPKATGSEMRSHPIAFAAILLATSLAAPAQVDQIYAWTNFAGKPGGVGNVDGTSAAARFCYPYGVVLDTNGNVYVADGANFAIRKVTAGGVTTTLAGGSHHSGTNDGFGDAATFDVPAGIALDNAGNAFIADFFNHTIRKMTSAGEVTTFAGSPGLPGSADGTNTTAQFNHPSGVAVDVAGNIFVTDYDNHTIRKVSPASVVTTFAGLAGASGNADGTNATARFTGPDGMAIDSSGNLFITDSTSCTIRKITPLRVVTTIAGKAGTTGSADGTNSAARFRNPYAITVDTVGNVFVADTMNHTIRKVTAGGVVTTLVGAAGGAEYADGIGSAARFNQPSGIAVDGAGNLFIADQNNQTIRVVTVASNVTTLAGCTSNAGSTNGIGDTARFSSPYDVAADSAGNLFVADYLNYTIRKATPGGIVTTLAGSAGLSGHTDANGSAARFFYPLGVAADTTGNVYVADTANQTIRMVTPSGDVTTLAGNPLSTGSADGSNSAARFYNPSGVAVDRAGNVFVADRANHTIRKITAQGQVTTLAGSPGLAGTNDGLGSVARFNSPYGVGVDQVGNILVADTYNLTIRRISPSGLVTTVAGTPGVAGSTDGSAQIALFNYPFRLACDAAGNIFVADTYNSTVRKITPSGTVTTIGGAAKSRSSVEGLVNDARFSRPYGIAVDSVGSIYVADGDNNNIWKGTPAALLFDTSPEAINWSPSGFQFSILGLRGRGPVAIYVSTNLIQWDVLMMHSPATGTLQVMDLEAGNSPVRYYRASE